MPNYCTLLDDFGTEVSLTVTSPALLKKLLKAAVQRAHERVSGAGLLSHLPGARVCHDVAAATLRSKKGTPCQRGCAKAVACNATWTRTRAAEAGYAVCSVCELCGSAPETLLHRLWFCPACHDKRQDVFDSFKP
eukprot:9316836-Pyramimonas_sp.AAC.1